MIQPIVAPSWQTTAATHHKKKMCMCVYRNKVKDKTHSNTIFLQQQGHFKDATSAHLVVPGYQIIKRPKIQFTAIVSFLAAVV